MFISHFFIHSFIKGHLGCFSGLLWIMRLWTWVCKYIFEILLSIPLGVYPETELLGHIVVIFLIFWGISILISTEAAPFRITNSAQGFPFLYIFSNTCHFLFFVCLFCFCFLGFFDSSHPNGCEMVSHCGFDLHFSNN